jgi:hypothetical protein
MLTELKFVQGSVAKKDFLPALTHFAIEGGLVRGYNGSIALCSPIPFDLACKPKAEPLIKAIALCEETVSLSITAAGRLSVKSGKFRAVVDCIEGPTAHVQPEGEMLAIDGAGLLAAVKMVLPFVGDDATRPWVNGVLLRGQSAFATNNVSLVEYWVGTEFPILINLPRMAVKEIVRIDEPPVSAQYTENSFTLHYTGGRWLRSQLLPTDWPDLSKILDKPSNQKPIDTRIFKGLDTLKPFIDKLGRVYFSNGSMCTDEADDQGATFMLDEANIDGVYRLEILRLLEDAAKTIDWSLYPQPCIFYGERLRGALIGMRR